MVVVACAAILGGACHRVVDAGFWFEPVTYGESEAMVDRLGGPVTAHEMTDIASVARSEITRAFTGMRITFSDRRDATYRVRVVQDLPNLTFPRFPGPAGESRAVRGFGGQGAVSFRMLTNNALRYAPPDADRASLIAAIGRGVGRAAVHEFAHQLLGSASIDDTTDIRSYEYGSADRREQYYGDMHWDTAGPLLRKRIGM